MRIEKRAGGMHGGAHHKHSRVREAAIHIGQHAVRNQDRGVVVVGGSIELGDLTGQSSISVLPVESLPTLDLHLNLRQRPSTGASSLLLACL